MIRLPAAAGRTPPGRGDYGVRFVSRYAAGQLMKESSRHALVPW